MKKTARFGQMLKSLMGGAAETAPKFMDDIGSLASRFHPDDILGNLRQGVYGDVQKMFQSGLKDDIGLEAIQKMHDLGREAAALSPSLQAEFSHLGKLLEQGALHERQGFFPKLMSRIGVGGVEKPALPEFFASALDDLPLSQLEGFSPEILDKLRLSKTVPASFKQEAALRGLGRPLTPEPGDIDLDMIRDIISNIRRNLESQYGITGVISPTERVMKRI